ncbi:MAG TPA: T9SS type A sorting domain-containing protein [Bacteroidia bacterium]|nr:T9SS type A sorting domain-containing protein [Bacteroidia bacterium]
MSRIIILALLLFPSIAFAQSQFTFSKTYIVVQNPGYQPFFTPYGTFQNLDSSYTLIGCVYGGTHTGKYFNYIVHITPNGDYDSTKYISPSGIGGIYTCATFLLYDSSLTSGFTSARWDHDTASIGNTTWTLHLTKDSDATTYIQLVKNNGVSMLLDTIGKTFYTYSRYLRFAEAPLIAPLSDGNLLIVYTNRNQELEVVKYNTHSYQIDYRFTATSQMLSLLHNVLQYANASGHINMIKTLDKGYLLSSKINRLDYDWQNNMLLMKFDSLGNFSWPFATGEQEIQSVPHRVYPNPTTEQVIFELTEQGEYKLKVTDVSGKVILETSAQNSKKITTIDWNKGVYFYTLSNKDKVAKGKILKF